MPSVKEDKQALDWLADNANDQRAPAVAQKLGVSAPDVQAWKWAKDNPADMRAIQVRNKVYDTVAETRPSVMDEQGGEIKGGVPVDRLVIKNLLDNDPEAQKAYLQKKGYKTRISLDGDIQAKGPGESYYKAIDPKGLDKWDAADLISDAAAGVVGAASAVKTAGPVGTLIGAAIGGTTNAGLELGKQAIGKAAGMRDSYNLPEVGRQGLIGVAVPVALDVVGAAAKGAGKYIGKGLESLGMVKPKINASEIEAATEAIGGKATPGQLVDSRLVNRAEITQWETPGKVGGIGLRKQIQGNIDAAKATAKEVVGNVSAKEGYELGNDFGKALTDKVAKDIAPAEAIYRKWQDKFADTPIDKAPIKDAIDKLAKDFSMDDAVLSKLNQLSQTADRASNLLELKKLRTAVGAQASEATNPEVRRSLGDLYVKLRDIRSQSIINMAEAENPTIGEIAKREIDAADATYRKVMTNLENVIGEKFKGAPNTRVKAFLSETPAVERMKNIINTNDVDSIAKFRSDFPDAFEFMRDQKVQELAGKALDPQGNIDPKNLVRVVDQIPTGTKAILFGDESPEKLKALKTYLQSLPSYKDHPNPSKTSFNQIALSLFKGGIDQLWSIKRSATYNILANSVRGKDILTTTGRAAQQPLSKGATMFGAQSGILNPLLPSSMEGSQ